MKVRESGMPDRAYWESLIDHCGLLGEMRVLDARRVFEFGPGYGSFLRCFADAGALVAGVDIEPRMIEATRIRLEALGMMPRLIEGDFLDPDTLAAFGVHDTVLLMNILHHDEPDALVRLACAMLEPGGRLAICHWRDDVETPRGPPPEMRVSAARAAALCADEGLEVIRSDLSACSPHHWYVVARA